MRSQFSKQCSDELCCRSNCSGTSDNVWSFRGSMSGIFQRVLHLVSAFAIISLSECPGKRDRTNGNISVLVVCEKKDRPQILPLRLSQWDSQEKEEIMRQDLTQISIRTVDSSLNWEQISPSLSMSLYTSFQIHSANKITTYHFLACLDS